MKEFFGKVREKLKRKPKESVSPYEVRYRDLEGDINWPWKEVLKNGEVIRTIPLADMISYEKRYEADEYTPPFARGRCVDISDGDYKVVLIDEDGNSDHVIKIFHSHIYSGANAEKQAMAVAQRINKIYQAIEENGLHVLPYEVFAASFGPHGEYAVYERQQRGIFVDPGLVYEPEAAEQVHAEMTAAHQRFYDVTMPQLVQQGLVTPHPYDPSNYLDHIALYTGWDMITQQIVARDVVDKIHIP